MLIPVILEAASVLAALAHPINLLGADLNAVYCGPSGEAHGWAE